MNVTINLTPEFEQRLRLAARDRGVSPDAYTVQLLKWHLPGDAEGHAADLVAVLQSWMNAGDAREQRETGEYLLRALGRVRRCAAALGQLAQTARGEAARLARLEACEAAPPAPQQLWERQTWRPPGGCWHSSARRSASTSRRSPWRPAAASCGPCCGSSPGTSSGSRPASPQPSPPPACSAPSPAPAPAASAAARGGCPRPRRILSRAALSASRCNPPLRASCQRLRACGKCTQEAPVAVMRKLAVLAGTRLRQDRPLSEPDESARVGRCSRRSAQVPPERTEMPASGLDSHHGNYWFIGTDYNEESFFVRHAYCLGANDLYKSPSRSSTIPATR